MVSLGEVESADTCLVGGIEMILGWILVVLLTVVGDGSTCGLEELQAVEKISRIDREIKSSRILICMLFNLRLFVIGYFS